MPELKEKTPAKKRTVAKMLPSVAWPVLYRRNDEVVRESMFSEQGWTFAACVVPTTNGLTILSGGFNWWADNNCCRGAGFSAVRINQHSLLPSPWNTRMVLNEKTIDIALLLNPTESPVPHVRTYDADFPVLTGLQADVWFAGVLMSALLGQTSYYGRQILRTVDKHFGLTQLAMRLISRVPQYAQPIPFTFTTQLAAEWGTRPNNWSAEKGTEMTTGNRLAAYTASNSFPTRMTRAHKTNKYKFKAQAYVPANLVNAVLDPKFKALVSKAPYVYGGASYLTEGDL